MVALRARKSTTERKMMVVFDILWVSAVFFVLYLGFIGLFFWGFKHFKKALDQESSQKEKDERQDDR